MSKSLEIREIFKYGELGSMYKWKDVIFELRVDENYDFTLWVLEDEGEKVDLDIREYWTLEAIVDTDYTEVL